MMANKILVVDDEKLIVKGIKFSLEQENMEVDVAYDGEEAFNLAKNNNYSIILLDVMLPKIDGLEVCRMIREFSNVPIIMVTERAKIWTRLWVLNMVLMTILQNLLIFLN